MKLICQVCKNDLANVLSLSTPIQGSMFSSLEPHLPNPFHPMVQWEHMKCPYCGYRPIIEPDKVLTDEGIISLENSTINVLREALEHVDNIIDNMDEVKHTMGNGAVVDGVIANLTSENILEKEATPGVPESGGAYIPEQVSEAEGSDPDPTGGVSLEAVARFNQLVDSGDIIQKGSWYKFEGMNHRRETLLEMFK